MTTLTVEKMIEACKKAPTKGERDKLWDSFRMMRFYELLDAEIFDDFCDKWTELKLYM